MRAPLAPSFAAGTVAVKWIKQSVARQTGVIVAGSIALATLFAAWIGNLALVPHLSTRDLVVGALCVAPVAGAFAAWVTERLLGARLSHLVDVIDGTGPHDDLARIRNLGEDEVGAIGHAVNRLLARVTSIRASMIDQGRELGKAQRELQLRTDLAEKTEELAQRLEERAMLFDILRLTSSSTALDTVLNSLVERVGQLLRLREVLFFIYDEQREEFVVQAAHGFNPEAEIVGRALKLGEGISGSVGKTREPLVIDDLSRQESFVGFWGLAERRGSLAAVPILHQERLLGVLTVTRPEQDPITDMHLRLMRAIADNAGLAIRNAQLFERMRELTTHDALTGLANRRLFREQLEREIDRARRFGHAFSLISIDVDRFRQLNEQRGYAICDATLQALAQLLGNNLRKVDTVARVGGDEYTLILPRTELREAAQVAEKLRTAVLALKVNGADAGLSVSMGVAQLSGSDDDRGESVIRRAEQALVAAKQAGRDRVFLAEASGALSPVQAS